MLPPVDEKVLRDNPDFEKLYKTLTTTVLDEYGCTINDANAERRAIVREVRFNQIVRCA
jgi:hypothetical protein